jgi:hypothetical protein
MSTLAKVFCIVLIAVFMLQITTTNAYAKWESETPKDSSSSTAILVALGIVVTGVVVYMIVKNQSKKPPELEPESDSTNLQSSYLNPLESRFAAPDLLHPTPKKSNAPTLIVGTNQFDDESKGVFVGLSFSF